MNVVLVILAFAVIFLYEVPNLVRNRLWRELVVFLFFFFSGFAISLLLTMGITLPNPLDGIRFLTKRLRAVFS